MCSVKAILLALGFMGVTAAQAAFVVSTGPAAATGVGESVLFQGCTGAVSSGAAAQGCLDSQRDVLLNFLSDEPLKLSGNNLEAADGGLSYLSISLADVDATFAQLVLNIQLVKKTDGSVSFTAAPGGASAAYVLGNGNNFFTFSGEDFRSISFNTVNDIVLSVGQVKLGGAKGLSNGGGTSNQVPEPGSLALLGLGVLGLAAASRKRKA